MTEQKLSRDAILLFTTRGVRLVAYGLLSIILVLYLSEIGLTKAQIGLLLTLTLIGDTFLSLFLSLKADQFGRRRTLIAGSALMIFGGVVFASTQNFLFLILAATIGVISPSGNEVGPFLSIEQAALTHTISDQRRTQIFGWYNLMGAFAIAAGAFVAGLLIQFLRGHGTNTLNSYRVIVAGYAILGLILALLFAFLSPAVEVSGRRSQELQNRFGLHESRNVVLRLAGLFAIDAFAGGLVMQSVLAYWFHIRFGVEPALLGTIFLAANVLAGISALAAAKLAKRIGLIKTMVFTHIPSNVLLILVPLMPSLPLAILILLIRFSISQMDVPTRQSYTMAVVKPDERSAAAGIAGVSRSIGSSLSPVLLGNLLSSASLLSFAFLIAGVLKIVYDLLLYQSFRSLKPPEEIS